MSCINECNLRFYQHSFNCLSGRGAEAQASVDQGILRAASVPHCQLSLELGDRLGMDYPCVLRRNLPC